MSLIRLNIKKNLVLARHNIDVKDVKLVISKKAKLIDLLNALPKKTHNGETYGLQLMVCNHNEWSVQYYSHFSHTYNTVYDIQVAKHPETAVKKMLKKFMALGHYKSLNVIGKR